MPAISAACQHDPAGNSAGIPPLRSAVDGHGGITILHCLTGMSLWRGCRRHFLVSPASCSVAIIMVAIHL